MSKSNVKFLIVGRSGSGKDYLKDLLQKNHNWHFVNSMTTRPPRFEGEDTHIFLSKEQATKYADEDKAAFTSINGYEYFATKQQIMENDAYIIDPKGVDILLQRMPDIWFEIIYISAPDKEKKRQMALSRADDPEKEREVYEKRIADEDEQFTNFEHNTSKYNEEFSNCCGYCTVCNDFKPDTMEKTSLSLNMRHRFYQNMNQVIDTLNRMGVIQNDKNDESCIVLYKNGTDEPIAVKRGKFIQSMADEQKPSMFARLMEQYLFTPVDKFNNER